MANPSYITPRRDVLHAVAHLQPERVLDVGCANGRLSAALKVRTSAHVVGIDNDPELAEGARKALDEVMLGDANEMLAALVDRGERFDLVVCADVLEHLADPWTALARVRRLCRGYALVSLPNVAHVSTIANLLVRRRWPYKDRGIHDRTHLRFFAERNLPEFFAAAGFAEVQRTTTHRIVDEPWLVNHAAFVFRHVPILSGLTTYQFVSLLEPI